MAPECARADDYCLSNAIRSEDRVYTVDRGQEVTIGWFAMSWDSSSLLNEVGVILTKEVLGYHARISGMGDSSASGVYAVAGCKAPNYYRVEPECPMTPDSVTDNHISFEIWGRSKLTTIKTELEHIPELIPEDAGSVGYPGVDGIYVMTEQKDEAFEHDGTALEYYKNYNARFFDHSHWFDKWYDVDPVDLRHCNDTRFMHRAEIQTYLDITGDLGGVVMENGAVVSAKCWNNSWWFAPSCRNRTETCIPSLTGSSGWGVYDRMQQATVLNLPLAITVARTTDMWRILGKQLKNLPYWWQPDASFIELDPTLIVFPPADAYAHEQGNHVSASTVTYLWKGIYNRMGHMAPRVHEFASRMQVTMDMIEDMIRTYVRNETGNMTHWSAACDWIRRSEGIWSTWIPSTTSCMPGAGMIDDSDMYVWDRSHASGCQWCIEGWHSTELLDAEGPTFVCRPCQVGTYQGITGQTDCHACEPGTFSNQNESRSCSRCGLGLYQNESGSTTCNECPGRTVTLYHAALSLTDCVCPENTYMSAGDDLQCEPCPLGMVCRVNSSVLAIPEAGQETALEYPFPEAAAGFMTLQDDPLRPFECWPAVQCPGGRPGSCAANRDPTEVACSRCMPDTYEGNDGACYQCRGDETSAIILLSIILVFSALVFLTYAINNEVIVQPHSTLTCVLLLGLMFMGIQSMGVFSSMAVQWAEPLKSILEAMKLLTFDLRILKVDCLVGSGPVAKFICRQLVAPICILIVAFILLLKQRANLNWNTYGVEIVNTTGAIFQVIFISIAISAWTPFVCYKHPDGNSRSMQSSPSILCWEDPSHTVMSVIGLVTCFMILVPFIAFVAHGTVKYKQLVLETQMNKSNQLHMYRFLFYRFTPESYYYGSIILARNLWVCVVPVVVEEGAVQIMLMSVILQLGAIIQLSFFPWRSKIANWMDGVLTASMVLLLLCVAMSTDFVEVEVMIGTLGTIVIFSFGLLLILTVAYSAYQRFQPRPFYHRFICHHKADAAAQARFLQLCIQARTGNSVFIDSDNLTNLDDLFDIVRCRVGQLIVYLTSSTLRRPWCAGEITVCFRTHKQVALVKMPTFTPPTWTDLSELGIYIDMSSTSLAQYGISIDGVAEAYRWLLDGNIPSVEPDGYVVGRAQFDHLVEGLLGRPIGRLPTEKRLRSGMIVIATDAADMEATAAAGILCNKIQQEVLAFLRAGICVLADHDELDQKEIDELVGESHALIILLSQNSLESTVQLNMIAAGMRRLVATDQALQGRQFPLRDGRFQVIPVTMPCFKFPDESYWKNIFPKLWADSGDDDAEAVRSLFKRICVLFNTGSSDQVLNAQAKDILHRIPQKAIHKSASNIEGLPALSTSESMKRLLSSFGTKDLTPNSSKRPSSQPSEEDPEDNNVSGNGCGSDETVYDI